MATFFTDELFKCSCNSLLFEEKQLKSYIVKDNVLINNTTITIIKCNQCGKEVTIDENNSIIKNA